MAPGRGPGDHQRRDEVLRRHRQGAGRRGRHGDARLAAGRMRGVAGRPGLRQRQAVQFLPGHGLAGAMSSRGKSPTPRTATSRPRSPATTSSSPEGIEGQVAYRGPLGAVAHQLIGGLTPVHVLRRGPDGPRAPGARGASCGSPRQSLEGVPPPHGVQRITIEAPKLHRASERLLAPVSEIEIGRGKRARRSLRVRRRASSPRGAPRPGGGQRRLADRRVPLRPAGAGRADGLGDVAATAIALGRLGGLGVLNLEGLWTRYDDPSPLLEEVAACAGPTPRGGCRRSTPSRSRPS